MKSFFATLAIVACFVAVGTAAGIPKNVYGSNAIEADYGAFLKAKGLTIPPPNNYTVPLKKNHVTISGISAGAAFTVQYQFAFAESIRGAGVVAGLPYNCAQDEIGLAFGCMDSPTMVNINSLLQGANISADFGLIEPLSKMKDHTVFLWSGTADSVVAHGTMLLVGTMYETIGVKHLTKLFNYSAEHSWVTNYYGNSCGYLGSPFINNCGYDFAGEYLSHAFANMNSTWNATLGTYNPSNMYQFDLGAFGASSSISLDTTAYLYVPSACSSANGNLGGVIRVGEDGLPKYSNGEHAAECYLHVNFHGCEQQRSNLSPHTLYVAHTGLNQWAESNNIVILYPQTVGNPLLENPNGCFDWWGYTNSNYANKKGPQMKVIKSAVDWLLGISS